MKKLFYVVFVAIAAMCVLNGCSNDEIETIPEKSPSEITRKLSKEDVRDILLTKGLLSSLQRDLYIKIQKSVAKGYDEKINLKELFCDKNIKMRFCDIVEASMPQMTRSAGSSVDELVTELSNSGMSVYWPYSENWDGEEEAMLVLAPDDEDVDVCEGYSIDNTDGNSILIKDDVDENYAIEHPVLVIDDVNSEDNDSICVPTTRANSSSTVTCDVWNLVSMQVTHQYDSWWCGGSEFDFQIVMPTGTGYAVGTTKFRVSFTRKEISKKVWKTIGYPLNTNWREDQITNYLLLSESDGGHTVNIPVSVDYKDGNVTGKASTTLTIKDNDERIIEMNYDRNYILLNDGLISDIKNRVHLKAPIQHEEM